MNKHKSVKKSKKMEDEYVLAKDGTGFYEPKGGYVSRQQLDRAVADARREVIDDAIKLVCVHNNSSMTDKKVYMFKEETKALLNLLRKEPK